MMGVNFSGDELYQQMRADICELLDIENDPGIDVLGTLRERLYAAPQSLTLAPDSEMLRAAADAYAKHPVRYYEAHLLGLRDAISAAAPYILAHAQREDVDKGGGHRCSEPA